MFRLYTYLFQKGEQLGVVGLDMMLDEITSDIPQYEVLGFYIFSVKNTLDNSGDIVNALNIQHNFQP